MPPVKAIIAAASEDIRASLSSMCAEAEISDITVNDGGNVRELFAEHNYDIALLVLPFLTDSVPIPPHISAKAMILRLSPLSPQRFMTMFA